MAESLEKGLGSKPFQVFSHELAGGKEEGRKEGGGRCWGMPAAVVPEGFLTFDIDTYSLCPYGSPAKASSSTTLKLRKVRWDECYKIHVLFRGIQIKYGKNNWYLTVRQSGSRVKNIL